MGDTSIGLPINMSSLAVSAKALEPRTVMVTPAAIRTLLNWNTVMLLVPLDTSSPLADNGPAHVWPVGVDIDGFPG